MLHQKNRPAGGAGLRTSGPVGRSDTELRQTCSETLRCIGDVDARSVHVNVRGGEVTLAGNVADVEAKQRLEAIIESCQGVRGITNLLEIREAEARLKSGMPANDAGDAGRRVANGVNKML